MLEGAFVAIDDRLNRFRGAVARCPVDEDELSAGPHLGNPGYRVSDRATLVAARADDRDARKRGDDLLFDALCQEIAHAPRFQKCLPSHRGEAREVEQAGDPGHGKRHVVVRRRAVERGAEPLLHQSAASDDDVAVMREHPANALERDLDIVEVPDRVAEDDHVEGAFGEGTAQKVARAEVLGVARLRRVRRAAMDLEHAGCRWKERPHEPLHRAAHAPARIARISSRCARYQAMVARGPRRAWSARRSRSARARARRRASAAVARWDATASQRIGPTVAGEHGDLCERRSRIEISKPAPRFTGIGVVVALGGVDEPASAVGDVEELAASASRRPRARRLAVPAISASTNLRIIAGITCESSRSKLSRGP